MPSTPTSHAAVPAAPLVPVPTLNSALVGPVLAFVPFVALSLAHLVFQLTGWHDASMVSKTLLMPALLLAVLLSTPARRSTATVLLALAITMSWLGDLALIVPGNVFFVVGLVFFLLAHLGYLAVFVRGLGLTKPRLWALVYVVWWLVFVLVLGPHTEALLIPVALYGAVLGAMAAFASRGTVLLAVGGALFLLSDTLLGSARFLQEFELWQSGFLIMVTYLAGQGLIAWAVVAVQRAAVGEGRDSKRHTVSVDEPQRRG